MYQVKWFNKRKGYGFVSGDLFVHHSDILVSGYKYLKRGEYITGEVSESGGKKKLSNIRAPMEGGKLMCEVEREDEPVLGRVDRLGSTPDGVVREDRTDGVGLVRQDRTDVVIREDRTDDDRKDDVRVSQGKGRRRAV
jgi:CspA family cold shock protein